MKCDVERDQVKKHHYWKPIQSFNRKDRVMQPQEKNYSFFICFFSNITDMSFDFSSDFKGSICCGISGNKIGLPESCCGKPSRNIYRVAFMSCREWKHTLVSNSLFLLMWIFIQENRNSKLFFMFNTKYISICMYVYSIEYICICRYIDVHIQ